MLNSISLEIMKKCFFEIFSIANDNKNIVFYNSDSKPIYITFNMDKIIVKTKENIQD
jgi:hypothetical protein